MKKSIVTILTTLTLLLSVNNIVAKEIKTQTTLTDNQDSSQLKPVFDDYFAIKEALIKSDGKLTSAKAKELLTAISAVKMEQLKTDEHAVWMKVMKKMTADAKSIASNEDLKKQREAFKTLSKNTYELIKVSKSGQVVYYQYCPMQDANWLSKDKAVKNPYYGASMLTCGGVVETIK